MAADFSSSFNLKISQIKFIRRIMYCEQEKNVTESSFLQLKYLQLSKIKIPKIEFYKRYWNKN